MPNEIAFIGLSLATSFILVNFTGNGGINPKGGFKGSIAGMGIGRDIRVAGICISTVGISLESPLSSLLSS